MIAIELIYQQIGEFARAHDARRVILFGSRARGDAGPKSDIDIAVVGCNDFSAFLDDVQERLWSLLCVDVVNLDDEVAPELRKNILRDGMILYEAF